jgi:hypothetical protein
MGLGLSNIATLMAPRPELERLVKEAELSSYALVSRYEHQDLLFSSAEESFTGIPVLDQTWKSTGDYNYNHSRMVAINQFYTADALKVIREFPLLYGEGVVISNRLFFSPSSMNLYFHPHNRNAVRPLEWLFNPLLYGALPTPRHTEQPHYGFTGRFTIEVNTGVTLLVAWWLVLGYGVASAFRGKAATDPRSKAGAIVMGFITFAALYVYAAGTMLELGENYRYRFIVEPLFFVLAACALSRLVRLAILRHEKRWSAPVSS